MDTPQRNFPDADTYLGLGYQWDEILHVPAGDLPATEGPPIGGPTTPAPPSPAATPAPPAPTPAPPTPAPTIPVKDPPSQTPDGCVKPAPDPPAFPVGVWQQGSVSFAKWRSRGINTIVDTIDLHGAAPFADWESSLACEDLYAIRPPQQSLAQENADRRLLALAQPDEPDIRTAASDQVAGNFRRWKAGAPDKPVLVNFSGDNVYEKPDRKALYERLMGSADWIAEDFYPIALYNRPDWVDLGQTASPPTGSVLDTLQIWAPDKPKYAFIEASNIPGPPFRAPTPDEFRGEIWDAVIHGARGIFYYAGGPRDDDAIDAGVVAEMTSQHAVLKQLGSMLAAPAGRRSAPAPFEIATRTYSGTAYTITLNFSHRTASLAGRSFAPYEVSVSPSPPAT